LSQFKVAVADMGDTKREHCGAPPHVGRRNLISCTR
jgi:hypothetical protein